MEVGTGASNFENEHLKGSVAKAVAMPPCRQIGLDLSLLSVLLILPLALSAPLDTLCEKPKSLGGQGYCGPSTCSQAASSARGCVITRPTVDYAREISKTTQDCRTCTTSTQPRCSAADLQSLFGKYTAVKAAYCTDKHLVIFSTGAPSWTPYLDDIPNPPGSTDSAPGA